MWVITKEFVDIFCKCFSWPRWNDLQTEVFVHETIFSKVQRLGQLIKVNLFRLFMAFPRLATSRHFLCPWLIYLPRAKRERNFERRSRGGEGERRKSREVDLFYLQELESERKFLAWKTWLTFLTFHVLRAQSSWKQKMISNKTFTTTTAFNTVRLLSTR